MSYSLRVVNPGPASKYEGYRELFIRRYMERVKQPTSFKFMLQILLMERGLSGVGFAKMVGCTKTWPSNIIRGAHKSPASIETLEHWADCLELNGKERSRFIGLAGLDHAPEWFVAWYWASKGHL